MQKLFVIHSSALLKDPYALTKFKEHEVFLPVCTLNEMEERQKDKGKNGYNSQIFGAILNEITNKEYRPNEPIIINAQGGKLLIQSVEAYYQAPSNDIISITQALRNNRPQQEIILITEDNFLTIRAQLRGLRVEAYFSELNPLVYSGHETWYVESDVINSLNKYGSLPYEGEEIRANMCLTLLDEVNPKHSALGRVKVLPDGRYIIVNVNHDKDKISGLTPLNTEQRFAIDLLLDPDVSLVTIIGATGSGKTLLSVAAACHQVELGGYKEVVVTRSEVAVGSYQGFLEGSIKKKTDPWLEAIYGCLDKLCGQKKGGSMNNSAYRPRNFYVDRGIVRTEPLAYIRGITWDNAFIIGDEIQNMDERMIKTIISRAGQGTKIVLLGDIKQIDDPRLDCYNNALTKVINAWSKASPSPTNYAHLTFTHNVRSQLSAQADYLL
jgi:PhoH-like ATPase